MTDIPDEMVERVARAIADVTPEREGNLFLPWGLYRQEQKARAYDAARAALKESGWAEMREALEEAAWFARNFPSSHLPDDKDFVTPLEKIDAALAVRKP